MAITPKPGWIVDPNNPNQVIQNPSYTTTAENRPFLGNTYTNGVQDYKVDSPAVGTTPAGANSSTNLTFTPRYNPYSEEERQKREQALQEQARIQREAIISAINTKYDVKKAKLEQMGSEALASTSSINLRSGLAGSDFGAAEKAKTKERTATAVSGSEAERSAEISDAVMAIEGLVDKRRTAENEGIALDQQFQKDNREAMQKQLSALAGKVTFEKLKGSQLYAALKESGLNDWEIDLAVKPKEDEYTYMALGDGRIMRYSKTPGSTAVPEFFSAPVGAGEEIKEFDGNIYNVKTDASGKKTLELLSGKKAEEKEIDTYTDSSGKRVSVMYDPSTGKTRSIVHGQARAEGGDINPTTMNIINDNAKADPDVSVFPSVRGAFEQGRSAAQMKNSTGDIILMRTLAKVTDPTTGVREEEYATFQSALGTLPRYYVNLTTEMIGKGKLTDEGRKVLMQAIQDNYNQKLAAYDSKIKFYRDQVDAIKSGKSLSGADIVPSYVAPEQTMVKSKTTGAVMPYNGKLTPEEAAAAGYEIVQ